MIASAFEGSVSVGVETRTEIDCNTFGEVSSVGADDSQNGERLAALPSRAT